MTSILGLSIAPQKPRIVLAAPSLIEGSAPDADYFELAKKLGVPTNLQGVIQHLNLRVYNTQHVVQYLDEAFRSVAETHGWEHGWVWRPLRKKDAVTSRSFNESADPYTKAVPYAVLKTVEAIQEHCPTAKFFVSDERRRSDEKDPFLMVTADEGRTLFIVERWDEPKFR